MTVRTYTENAAAQVLEIPRSTLQLRRNRGLVRLDAFVHVDQPQTVKARIYYDADLVDEVMAGDASLYRSDDEDDSEFWPGAE
jgi:hypothetical protein